MADLAGGAPHVLDVGGRGSEMARLRPRRTTVVSANIEEPCDVVVAHDRLPFADRSFDAVTSCDVLEHIPPAARDGHLAELVRVARDRVILCFPVWSPQKEAAEHALHARLADLGVQFDFLDEHLEHGLPLVSDVLAAVHAVAPTAQVVVRYQQGIEERDQVVLDAVVAYKHRKLRPLLRFARAWLRRPATVFSDVPTPESSRAYVVIQRGEPGPE